MTEYDDNTVDTDDSWSAHFAKLITNAIYAALLIGAGSFIVHLSRTHVIDIDRALWIGGAACIAGGIFALIAAWHAVIAIFWPVLVFFGLVGVAAVRSGVSAVKSVDEGGGLRSIVHRVWYGKQGPPR